jgi:hypothetical protein
MMLEYTERSSLPLYNTEGDEKHKPMHPNGVVKVIDEPLLRESPERFVLFPIQYLEVRTSVNSCA